MDQAESKRPRASKKIGRPSKLTPEVEARLLQALSVGAFRKTAAAYAGIGRSTLYRWVEQGEADIEAGIKSDLRKSSSGPTKPKRKPNSGCSPTST
jgi:hypothetical protein